MNFQPTLISYRSPSDKFSHFLNIEDLFNCQDYREIKKKYIHIFNSCTAYDPNCLDSLIILEENLYERIIKLQKEKKREYRKKNRGRQVWYSIFSLGIRYLVYNYKKNRMQKKIQRMGFRHYDFGCAFEHMKKRLVEKEVVPKPEFIKELEQQRLESVDDELARLKKIPRIARSFKNVKKKKLTKEHLVAYGHSLELQNKLKDTHYIINHGQNLNLMLVNIITKQLKKEFEPTFYESFEVLRHDTALSHIKEDIHTIDWYKSQIRQRKTYDHKLKKDLISGDCVLESRALAESALDFFSGRTNIANSGKFRHKLLLTIIKKYIPDKIVAEKLCKRFEKVMHNCPKGGNLYSICVPKEKFDQSCYFSRAFGFPADNAEKLKQEIEQMQSGDVQPHAYFFGILSTDPQIRVLTHKIRAEDGYHVIVNSTLGDKKLLEIEEEISLCIQTALTGYRLQNKPKKLFSK